MKRIAIDVAVDSDGFDAHLFTRPDDPAGNLAAVRDQDLFKFSDLWHHALQKFKVQCPVSASSDGLGTLDIGHWAIS